MVFEVSVSLLKGGSYFCLDIFILFFFWFVGGKGGFWAPKIAQLPPCFGSLRPRPIFFSRSIMQVPHTYDRRQTHRICYSNKYRDTGTISRTSLIELNILHAGSGGGNAGVSPHSDKLGEPVKIWIFGKRAPPRVALGSRGCAIHQ